MHACGAADLHNCLHCPGGGPPAGLLQLWAPQGSAKARHLCWLAQGGIRHGSLLLDRETRPPSDLDYLRLDPDIPNPSADPVISMVSHPWLGPAGFMLIMPRGHAVWLPLCMVHRGWRTATSGVLAAGRR